MSIPASITRKERAASLPVIISCNTATTQAQSRKDRPRASTDFYILFFYDKVLPTNRPSDAFGSHLTCTKQSLRFEKLSAEKITDAELEAAKEIAAALTKTNNYYFNQLFLQKSPNSDKASEVIALKEKFMKNFPTFSISGLSLYDGEKKYFF